MKYKLCSVLFFFVVANAFATFHGGQFQAVTGGINVYALNGQQAGDWLFYSIWGVPDLQAISSDNRTFILKPNVNAYADAVTPEAQAEWRNGVDGNRWLSALTVWDRMTSAQETGASFTFSVDDWGDLNSRYTVKAFIQLLDPDNDYQVLAAQRDEFTISSVTASDVTLSLNFGSSSYNGKLLQAGFSMEGINANPDDDWGSVTVTAKDIVANIPDDVPPSPSPMQFDIPPMAISDYEIEMTASNATDNAYGVEYYFICDTDRDFDSEWQDSPFYRASGLASGTEYIFRVTTRDTSPMQNVTVPSAQASATTLVVDTAAPTPDPMEIVSSSSLYNAITLTAATAMDDSLVEYKFTNVSGDGSDSDWQSSPVYTDSGLLPGSVYAYTVQARDLSSATNTTASSETVTVVTANDVPSGLVLIPNGDFENGGDQWRSTEPDGNIVLSYEASGGSGDNGGYAQHGRTGAAWAVLVSPIPAGEEGGGIPLSYFGAEAGQTLTFAMDQRTISGTAAPALKIEAFANNERVGLNEVEATYSGDWTTHSFDWELPAETELLLFVPVAGADSIHGYDNIGVVVNHPNAAQIEMADVAEDGSFCFEVDGMAGETYVVQWKELLTDAGWNTVLSTNGVGTLKVSVPVDTEKEQLFYRIISTF